MKTQWTEQEIHAWVNYCTQKASHDPIFRQELLANPLQALQGVVDKPIPDGIKIKIIEQQADYDFTFVLSPVNSAILNEEDCSSIVAGASCNVYSAPYGCGQYGVCRKDGGK